jgi:hypothetical protein
MANRRRAAVSISVHPLWRLRIARELPRYLVYAACAAGLLASARFAISPPRPRLPPATAVPPPPDLAAEGYASLFARRYLTWDAAQPQSSQRQLASLLGPGMDPAAGLRLPTGGEQRVEWAEVVQGREVAHGEDVYTVAAQTDTAGLQHLTVRVVRRADGSLAIAGYPAFVGAPASGPAQVPTGLAEVGDPQLATVVERALRNYLGQSPNELAADLAGDARVSLPELALSLESVLHLVWSPDRRSVRAVVQARDTRGVQYTLDYELDVTVAAGRWEVGAIQMNPDT